MVTSTAIVLEGPGVLAGVCGANDSNLRLMEELLSAPIRSRGNEIFIESEDEHKRTVLRRMMEDLTTHVGLGRSPGPDLVRAVYEAAAGGRIGESDLLKEAQVAVPGGFGPVYPRSIRQALYLEGMRSHELTFGIGPAGTGKTYLAVAFALSRVLSRQKRKLILTRPVVEAGESLGFLPGDLAQKISPYLRPLYDSMDDLVPHEVVRRMEENGVIEIAPLAYMRGRSLKNCFIILDEAQNTTREQIKMFLTRIGEGSEAVVTGDLTQIDLPRSKDSGLLHAARILGGLPELHFSYFSASDVVRNPLVRKIVDAYEADEARRNNKDHS